jgi:hypothetical protein
MKKLSSNQLDDDISKTLSKIIPSSVKVNSKPSLSVIKALKLYDRQKEVPILTRKEVVEGRNLKYG